MSLFSPEAFSLAPWSTSKAQSAHRCPHQFQRKYINNERGKGAPEQSLSRIGNAAHSALELVLKGEFDLREALCRASIKEKLTTVEMDEFFALAHNISEFLKKLETFKAKHKVTEQMVERRFGLTENLEPTEFWNKEKKTFFRGVWDLCMRADEKYLVIIDHKSGSVKDLTAYEDQLKIYSIAGLRSVPNIVGVQTALNYIQNDAGVTWDKMNSAEKITVEFLPWFVSFINEAARMAVFNTPKKGWWCAFCEFTQTCPLK